MELFVTICTIDEGILRVPSMLRKEKTAGVTYVVSWQQTRPAYDNDIHEAVSLLENRDDTKLTQLTGRGLSRNRNHAIATALSLLPDPLADAVLIITDDDEQFSAHAFETIRDTYLRYNRLDVALLRAYAINGQPLKPYPAQMISYRNRPRTYYPSSVEMTFRSRLWHMGLRFDERFGLGSEMLCSGEEEVFLFDALQKRLNVVVMPIDLCSTTSITTGSRVLDPAVLRSKGAVYGYTLNYVRALLRGLHEALSLGIRHRSNPLRLFRHILHGINYIRS